MCVNFPLEAQMWMWGNRQLVVLFESLVNPLRLAHLFVCIFQNK